MNEKETQGFDVPEINEITNQKGIIPADSVTTDQKLAIPNVNLANSAPEANQALTEAGAQVESQTKLDELTNQRIADTQAQRSEQESLIAALGEQGGEIQTAFRQGQEALKPIEKEVMDLTSLINTKTQAIQNQLIDESGRRIPQAFITGRQAIIQQRGTAELSALGGLLDAKNGQLELAQNKIDRSLNILREVNATEIAQKEAKVALRREITGESRAEEENELTRLKEEQAKFEKERDEISSIALQAMQAGAGAGEITAITNAKSKDEAIAAAKSLGKLARMDMAIKSATLSNIKAAAQQKAAEAGGKLTQEDEFKIDTFKDVITLAQELQTMPGKGQAVGARIGIAAIPGTDASTYKAKAEQLINTLAVGNLDKMKGSMSDNDINFLKSIGSGLARNQSEDAWDSELQKIIDNSSTKLSDDYGVSTSAQAFTYNPDGTVSVEVGEISNEDRLNRL